MPTFSTEPFSFCQTLLSTLSVFKLCHWPRLCHWLTRSLMDSVSDPKWGESLSSFPSFGEPYFATGDRIRYLIHISNRPSWKLMSSFLLGRRLLFSLSPLDLAQSTFGPKTDENWQIITLNSRPWKLRCKNQTPVVYRQTSESVVFVWLGVWGSRRGSIPLALLT